MSDLFRGTTVLVTGASSGLGTDFARALAERGAELVLTARSRDRLEALAHDLKTKSRVVVADLSTVAGVDKLMSEVDDVDHLINNAGFGIAGAFEKADEPPQAEMVRLNCEALMRLSRRYLPKMLEKKRGGIIHVASTAGHQPMPFMATYGATKAFVLSFSVAVAAEVKGSGVRVLALCPGPVPTGFQEVAGIEPGMERIAALSSTETVRRAIEAYEAGDTVCIPGAVNRVQTMFSKLMPRAVVTHTIAAAMHRMGRTR
jgi:short-subunit dehydrogenase